VEFSAPLQLPLIFNSIGFRVWPFGQIPGLTACEPLWDFLNWIPLVGYFEDNIEQEMWFNGFDGFLSSTLQAAQTFVAKAGRLVKTRAALERAWRGWLV
jgi:hypothetical protein